MMGAPVPPPPQAPVAMTGAPVPPPQRLPVAPTMQTLPGAGQFPPSGNIILAAKEQVRITPSGQVVVSEMPEFVGCCSDCFACHKACCAPHLAVGEIAEAAGQNGCVACTAYTCLSACCLQDCVHGCVTSQKLRKKYGLKGNCVVQGMQHCCCSSCAKTQELRLVKLVKETMNPQRMAWELAPVRQVMAPGVTMAGPGGMAPPAVANSNKQMDPAFEGCGMADKGACFTATCLPCMAVGEIAEAAGKDYKREALIYGALCLFCGPTTADCYHGCTTAQALRTKNGVNTDEGACKTCMCHTCTGPFSCLSSCAFGMVPCAFAKTQELRFARKLKAQTAQEVALTGPVRQSMSN